MPRVDLRDLIVAMVAVVAALHAAAQEPKDAPLHRFRAPITVDQPAAFVRLPLGAEVYARSRSAELADLRVLDANGARVPFALLQPRPVDVQDSEQWRDATLYRLPPRRRDSDTIGSPVEIVVGAGEGGRVVVKQRGVAVTPQQRSPGWLVDLGERTRDQPSPRQLKLQWSGPAEFSIAYVLEHSADLRQWRRGGGGQLLALASAGGALTQPDVPLPADCERFVRIIWQGTGSEPVLTAARAATVAARSVTLDPSTEIVAAPSAPPPGKAAAGADDAAAQSLHFDLGAVLPLEQLDLRMGGGTRVLPVRVQTRDSADGRWEPLASTVFYRLEQGADVAQPPPLALRRNVRYVRLIADERAAMPRPEELRLVAQARLASLVFAAQGSGRLELLAGADQAAAGALPLATLVPDLDRERERFGRASLGAWAEVPAAVAQAQSQAQRAAMRPWLLWAVLIAGVAGLAWMVWRMLRQRPGAGSPGPSA